MRPIFVVEKPPAFPYICMRCRRSDGNMQGFVDTGVELEYDGVIYFCYHCADDFVKAYPNGVLIEQLTQLELDYSGRLEEAQRICDSFAQIKAFWLTHGLDIEVASKFSGPMLSATKFSGPETSEPMGIKMDFIKNEGSVVPLSEINSFQTSGNIRGAAPVGASEASVSFSVPVLENSEENLNGRAIDESVDSTSNGTEQSIDVPESPTSSNESGFDPASVNFDSLLKLD